MKPFQCLLIIVAVNSLFLPFYGFMADHHFTERQPSHRHIYTSGVHTRHIHPYEVPHTHGDNSDVNGSTSENGIVFLPPDEEGVPGATCTTLTVALLSTVMVLAIPTLLKRVFPLGQETFRPFISILDPPPPRSAF